jgi:hypothetical protein
MSRPISAATGNHGRTQDDDMKESILKKAFSPEQVEQLAKIAALPEDQIDTEDIPQAPKENWVYARGRLSDRDQSGSRTPYNRSGKV